MLVWKYLIYSSRLFEYQMNRIILKIISNLCMSNYGSLDTKISDIYV